MNTTRLYSALERALRVARAECGCEFAVSTADNEAATVGALLAYSRYRPALRRMGEGVLLANVAVGSSTLFALGGVWSMGQVLTLDSLGVAPETVTIAGLAVVDRGHVDPLAVLQITVAAPVQFGHPSGALLSSASPGLNILAGVGTYGLPPGWIDVDRDSFDLAIGARVSQKRQAGFYDGAYQQAQNLSGLGYGMKSDFGGGYGSLVAQGANFFGLPMGLNEQQSFDFLSDAPARLVVKPVPERARVLDFYYQAIHVLGTVPDADAEAVTAYAAYSLLLGIEAEIGRLPDRVAGGEREVWSKAREGLDALAKEQLAIFERLVANRPYAAGG